MATISKTRLLVAWQSGDFAEADVVVEIENTGGTWVELDPARSDYKVFSANASLEAKGSFLYAYPKYLAPGQIGYIAENFKKSGTQASNLRNLEANVYFYSAVETDAILLKTAGITNRKAPSESEGPTTTGTLTNTSSKRSRFGGCRRLLLRRVRQVPWVLAYEPDRERRARSDDRIQHRERSPADPAVGDQEDSRDCVAVLLIRRLGATPRGDRRGHPRYGEP